MWSVDWRKRKEEEDEKAAADAEANKRQSNQLCVTSTNVINLNIHSFPIAHNHSGICSDGIFGKLHAQLLFNIVDVWCFIPKLFNYFE